MKKYINKKALGDASKLELVFGLTWLLIGILLHKFQHDGIMAITLSFLMVVFIVVLLKNIKKHIYWEDKPLLAIYSVFYKADAYVLILFSLANYPAQDGLTIMVMVLCIGYIFLSYFNKKQYRQMLEAYIYMVVSLMSFIN